MRTTQNLCSHVPPLGLRRSLTDRREKVLEVRGTMSEGRSAAHPGLLPCCAVLRARLRKTAVSVSRPGLPFASKEAPRSHFVCSKRRVPCDVSMARGSGENAPQPMLLDEVITA